MDRLAASGRRRSRRFTTRVTESLWTEKLGGREEEKSDSLWSATMAFIMIGHSGTPIYELLDFAGTKREDLARQSQFLLHSALDSVDLAMWHPQKKNDVYLKTVDSHNEQLISAYVTPGGVKFMVLHDTHSQVRSSSNNNTLPL